MTHTNRPRPLDREKIAPWTNGNSLSAYRQGWNIFNSGEDNARIERDDEADKLKDDDVAWEFVIRGAAAGKEHCRRALFHVAVFNPHEWAQIRKYIAELSL